MGLESETQGDLGRPKGGELQQQKAGSILDLVMTVEYETHKP